jgi:hypothetical protein
MTPANSRPEPAHVITDLPPGPEPRTARPVRRPPSRGAGRYRQQRVALVDLLDRVLGTGVVILGDVTLSIADVDMVTVSVRALISSASSDLDLTELRSSGGEQR